MNVYCSGSESIHFKRIFGSREVADKMGTVAFQGDNDEMIVKNRYRDSKSVMLPSSFNGGRKGSGDLETREMVDDHLAWQLDHRDDIVCPSHICDDQVQVNIGMADLMAYLQVVANNSNNLPLTRRDNPELSKMMSELTSEEYAMKSAAFIPADVRVIGGTFLRYGRVWDLPTSREYNASDGAHEPGTLSYESFKGCIDKNSFI